MNSKFLNMNVMDQPEISISQSEKAGIDFSYRRYLPAAYKPRMSIFWWIHKKAYLLFIIRELTSVFIAVYAVILLITVAVLKRGPEEWEALMTFFSSPLSVALHVVILVFALYHSVTWFLLAPTATVVKIGRTRIPDAAIIFVNFLMWLALSAFIIWIFITV